LSGATGSIVEEGNVRWGAMGGKPPPAREAPAFARVDASRTSASLRIFFCCT